METRTFVDDILTVDKSIRIITCRSPVATVLPTRHPIVIQQRIPQTTPDPISSLKKKTTQRFNPPLSANRSIHKCTRRHEPGSAARTTRVGRYINRYARRQLVAGFTSIIWPSGPSVVLGQVRARASTGFYLAPITACLLSPRRQKPWGSRRFAFTTSFGGPLLLRPDASFERRVPDRVPRNLLHELLVASALCFDAPLGCVNREEIGSEKRNGHEMLSWFIREWSLDCIGERWSFKRIGWSCIVYDLNLRGDICNQFNFPSIRWLMIHAEWEWRSPFLTTVNATADNNLANHTQIPEFAGTTLHLQRSNVAVKDASALWERWNILVWFSQQEVRFHNVTETLCGQLVIRCGNVCMAYVQRECNENLGDYQSCVVSSYWPLQIRCKIVNAKSTMEKLDAPRSLQTRPPAWSTSLLCACKMLQSGKDACFP